MREMNDNSLTGLVVDPNNNMQSIIAGMLRAMTQRGRRVFKEVRKTAGLQSAWALTNGEEKIDIVICDVDLSGRYDGIRFLRNCSSDPKRKNLPFIMMTGVATADTVPALVGSVREWGAHCLLVKPFAQTAMEDKVHRVISKIRSSEEMIYRKITDAPPEEAIATICRLEQKGFTGPKLCNIAGEKHLEAGEKKKAAERFERAVAESETAYLAALRNHASIQEELGNLDEALVALEKLDKLSPLDTERKVKLGELFFKSGMEEKGRAAFDQAVALARKSGNEKDVRTKVESILALARFEDPDMKTIRENLHDLKACNEVALRLRKEGKFDRAEACYDLVLSHHPNHPIVLHNKAVLFMSQERYRDAIPVLEEALAQAPRFEKARDALELCRKKLQPTE